MSWADVIFGDLSPTQTCSYCGKVKFRPDLADIDSGCVLWCCETWCKSMKLDYIADPWERMMFQIRVAFHYTRPRSDHLSTLPKRNGKTYRLALCKQCDSGEHRSRKLK